MKEFAGKKILIIVENLPVPFDRRVWQEAKALKEKGAEVYVICPKMKEYIKSFEIIEGIHIYRHPLPQAKGKLGYLLEYSFALFWEFFLSLKIYLKHRFHVIHGCNPPDLIFLVALPFKLLGVKYVFDHHDLCPELYEAKFRRKGMLYKLLLLAERLTFKFADYVISTNESYKKIALQRGKVDSNKVYVVRSAPDLSKFNVQLNNHDLEKYKKGSKYLIGYVGVIGEQDGLDLLMYVAKLLKNKENLRFAIIGEGPAWEDVKLLAKKLGVDDIVDFYGRVSDEELVKILSSCDVCVNPDKPCKMNELSTMNKIMEYMALKKPIVQFDLKEGKFSAQKASLYAKKGDIKDFAEKILILLRNEKLRKEMGEYGYKRLINDLSWDKQKENLWELYRQVLFF